MLTVKKVILFDYDGTIVDTFKAYAKLFVMTSKKFGLKKMNAEDFRDMYDDNFLNSLMKAGVSDRELVDFISDMKAHMSGYELIKPFRGIKKVIEALSKDNDIFVITSNLTKVIEDSIIHFKIRGIREVIGGDKEVSKVKKIDSLKKRYPSHKLFYIGDTVGDVKEAKQANIISIAVTWGYHSRKRLEKTKTDYVVDKPEELLKILN